MNHIYDKPTKCNEICNLVSNQLISMSKSYFLNVINLKSGSSNWKFHFDHIYRAI